MSNLLRHFPISAAGHVGYANWHPNLITWMQEVYRAVSGEYNVIHLTKASATEDIGGVATTATRIAWDEEAVKQPGFVHSTTSLNSRVTVENAGRYMLKANVVAVNGATAAVQMRMYPKVNGSTNVTEGTTYDYAIGSGWRVNLNVNTELDLEAGDYIEIETYVVLTSGDQAVVTSATECELIVRRIA